MDLSRPTVYPTQRYADAPAAIRFLTEAFGLTESLVVPGPDGTIAHAELSWGSGVIMLGSATDGSDGRLAAHTGPTWFYLVVDDPDAHYRRAVAAGADIVQELTDGDRGSRSYTARDPEGSLWTFGTYQPAPTR
jgi:uncharacterized glyoxalase superfamily protein PhnB